MYNRTNPIIKSDNKTEDKGYNPKHKQTEGGYNAYERGEQPLTYWTKKAIIKEIFRKLQVLNTKSNSKEKYTVARTLIYAKKKVSDYIEELNKHTLKELQAMFLQFTGVHYTGNYYRYTKFYGILEKTIIKDICNRYKPPIPIQTLIEF